MPHCRFKVKNDYERRITYMWPNHSDRHKHANERKFKTYI